jgi:hypothetical protein
VLPRGIVAPFDGAFIRVATVPFEVELHAFPAAQPAGRFQISGQQNSPFA